MSNPKLNVRHPQRPDVRDILRVERKSHPRRKGEKWMTENELVGFIGRKGTRAWVGEEGKGNVVGFALVANPNEDELVIEKLCVDADYSGNGFEERLLKEVCHYNEKRGLKSEIVAYVRESDFETLRQFKTLGFQSKLARNYFGQEDAVRFAKPAKLN